MSLEGSGVIKDRECKGLTGLHANMIVVSAENIYSVHSRNASARLYITTRWILSQTGVHTSTACMLALPILR